MTRNLNDDIREKKWRQFQFSVLLYDTTLKTTIPAEADINIMWFCTVLTFH